MTTTVWDDRVSQRYVTVSQSGPNAFTANVVYPNSIVGSDQPNWRTVISSGGDATGSLVVDVTRLKQYRTGRASVSYATVNPGTGLPDGGTFTETFSGSLARVSRPNVPGLPTEVSNRALMRIVGLVRDQTRGFAGITFLGELGDTMRQVRRPAEGVFRGMSRYMGDVGRHGQRISRQRYPSRRTQWAALQDMVSSSYLEWVFGIRPLLNDVDDATQALARFVVNEQPRQTLLKAFAQSGWRVTSADDTVLPNYFHARNNEREDLFAKRKYVVCYRPTVTGLAALNDPITRFRNLAGFTWSDFIPDLWNCLPWSFVVDYFTNIGDILECSFLARDNLAWAYMTDIRRNTRTAEVQLDRRKVAINAGARFRGCSPGNHLGYTVVERTSIVRTRGIQLPLIPAFEARLPGMHQVFNLGALFAAQTDIRNRHSRP